MAFYYHLAAAMYKSGKECVLPFALGGQLHYNPVYMKGILSCPIEVC